MTKIRVDIKSIDELDDNMILVLHCRKPKQKNRPLPAPGREALDRSNAQFQVDAEQHREDIREYKKVVRQLHSGRALLIQDYKEEEEASKGDTPLWQV